MDAYTERTVKLMEEKGFANYIKVMGDAEMPAYNKIRLVLMKVHEFEEMANQQILAEASARKAEQERRRREDV